MKTLLLFLLLAIPSFAQLPPAPSSRRAAIVWTGTSFAATVADVESTHYCLNRGYVEANPLFGRNPSRAKMYGISLPVAAAYNLFAAYVRKKVPGRKLWMWMPTSITAVHGAAAVHNWALCH